MRRFDSKGWAALAVFCIAGALGCQTSSHSAKQQAPPKPPEETLAEPAKPATTASAADLETVYFALDEYLLDEKARKALARNAELIGEHPEWGKILVEGHCDERGSEEYNLVLGKRRAAEVAKYLVNLGVPAERLTTVTHGEARPAVNGESETAWKWNRRSVFLEAEKTADTRATEAGWTAAK